MVLWREVWVVMNRTRMDSSNLGCQCVEDAVVMWETDMAGPRSKDCRVSVVTIVCRDAEAACSFRTRAGNFIEFWQERELDTARNVSHVQEKSETMRVMAGLHRERAN